MKISLLFSAFLFLPVLATASDDLDDWSLGPVGGTFRTNPGTSMLSVKTMPAGTPGAVAGLLAGDRILGAFGESFGVMDPNPTTGGYKGPVQDLGSALDRAEANGGALPLTVLRPGTGAVGVTVNVPAAGAFGPAYPRGSTKYDAMYQEACARIHSKVAAGSNGNSAANTGWFGLTLLSHPNWADTTGAKPYRLSLNKLRDRCISVINACILEPVEDTDPAYVNTGLENWELSLDVAYLAEYKNKSGDNSATVTAAIQRGTDALANRIHDTVGTPGHMGHGGVTGDYGNWSLNIINAHVHMAFAMAKRAGATVNQTKWDLSWNSCLKAACARSTGHLEDGYVDYGPPAWGQGTGYDAAGRTAASVFGFLNYGQTPTADDTDALNRMKGYLSRNYHRMQHTHAYTVGGVCFNQLALPYLPDRDQRYFMDNVKYFYQFHRTTTSALTYFGGRMNNGGDSDGGYLGFGNVMLYNVGLAGAVANRGLPSIPAENTARIYADMKSPWTKWPTITAKTATLTGLSHPLNVDICDYNGAVTTADNVAWTKVSGPGTVTFSSPATTSTSVDFSQVGQYRLQLAAVKSGYSVTELYDFLVIGAAPPAGYTLGSVTREIYTGISGTTVATLTSHTKYPDSPNISTVVSSLDLPSYGDNYGQRLRGWIVPPSTGSYIFYIASDDASQFRFNSTGSSEAGATAVCSVSTYSAPYAWSATAAQTSTAFNLTAGQPYFFEVHHKEGTGGDHVAVAWKGPGMAAPVVIDGTALATDSSASILKQPVSRMGAPGGSATFTTSMRGAGPFLYEWKLDGVSYWGVSATPDLVLSNISTGSAGVYSCTVTWPGGTLTSNAAVLTLAGTGIITPGGLKREVWNNISGSTVASLTGNSQRYPRFPDVTGIVAEAEGPNGFGDEYGQRLSGWVTAPVTGIYKFFIASDDDSELWLSPSESAAGKVKIAGITGYTNARNYSAGPSGNINLTAGQRYYIEAIQKDNGGGDHLAISWQKPGDPVPATGSAPIPGAFLSYQNIGAGPEFSGLVSHWKFDEATGINAGDTMAAGNDGVLNGPAWTAGKRGTALLFDTTDQVVCKNAGALDGLTPFTVSAWVKVNAGNATEGVIVQQRAINGYNGTYTMKVTAAGKLNFMVYGNVAEQFNLTGAATINDGQWHHVAAGRDAAGGAFVFVDAVLDGSVTGTTMRNLSSSIDVGIGADIRDNNKNFRGVIDDVRIYNRLLPSSEIAILRNKVPVFTTDPIAAPSATEDAVYSASLNGSATDADAGENLTYSKISGPAWLAIAANGALTGSPTNGDTGVNTFVVRVTDSTGAIADAVLNLNVTNINDAPSFVADPLTGPDATEMAPYSGSIAGSAADVDPGDTISYSKTDGPYWLTVSPAGGLGGTPGNNDAGGNVFTIRVTDTAGLTEEATLQITVINNNRAPVFTADPFTAAATEDTVFSGSLAAIDPDAGDTLTFSKISGPAWLAIASNGTLGGTPLNANVGANSFVVRVSDNNGATGDAVLNIIVANTNDAPVFATSPITKSNAAQDTAYTGQTLAGTASDPDSGASLTYSRISGPAWLTIAANGTLTGTPSAANTGANTWTVRATDNNGAMVDATLNITVTAGLPAPWLTGIIGSPGLAGTATHTSGAFTVAGAGLIGSTADAERYVYQTLTGDGSIVARISTLGATGGTTARAGIQIRETLAAGSKTLTLAVNGNGAYKWMRRTATGGNTSNTNSSSGTAPNIWIRLVRAGNVVTAARSTNGTTWTNIGSVTITMTTNCYIGLTAGSGSTTLLNTSTFTNLTVIP